jgi:hypothetical protein
VSVRWYRKLTLDCSTPRPSAICQIADPLREEAERPQWPSCTHRLSGRFHGTAAVPMTAVPKRFAAGHGREHQFRHGARKRSLEELADCECRLSGTHPRRQPAAINGHSAISQGSHLNVRLTMKPAEKPTPTTRPLLPVRLTVPYVRSSAALSSRSTVQRSNCAARLPDRTSKWFD